MARAKVEETVKRTRRTRAEIDAASATTTSTKKVVATTPVRKPKQVEEAQVKRSRKVVEEPKPQRVKKSEVAVAKAVFNPMSSIDDELDGIEKDYSLSNSSLDVDEQCMSTSMLTIDVILSKGLRPGWYTFFGGEQSCKSTGANTIMVAATGSSVPVVSMWDYEGCYTLSTVMKTNLGEITFAEVLKHYGISEIQEDKTFFDVVGLEVETLGQMVKVDKLYYSGVRPETKVVTETGRALGGYAHPVMCVSEEGDLVYRNIEQIKVGDRVVCIA